MTVYPAAPFCDLLRVRFCLFLAAPAFACGWCFLVSVPVAAILTATVCAVFSFAWWGYLPRYAASCAVERRDGGIAVTRGVWWKRTFFLPDERTVFAERIRTPLGRLFGVEAVRFHLVGRTLTAAGLCPEDAVRLLEGVRRE